jgi:chloramphenicol-sensitive protein RarD
LVADAARREARIGVACAASAYAIWGLVPLYFKAVAEVSAFEIIAHRVLWSLALLGVVLMLMRNRSGWDALRAAPALWGRVALATLFVTVNWLIFVWAVNAGRVLETSLGYYINPLVSILFAYLFLGERLRPLQMVALGCAALGVANQVVALGQLPWVSLALAVSFAAYGLMRKHIPLDATSGLFYETLIAAPVAAAYLAWTAMQGRMVFGTLGTGLDALIAFSGVVTALPLVMFAAGSRRLRLTTMGFLQYLAPTLSFALAVFAFGEPFTARHGWTFALIWSGLAFYTVDILRRR